MKVGIDFGSTYSTVSAYDQREDRVEALTLVEGESASIPSVVSISSKGKVTCGKGAKDQIGRKTARIFEAFKMLLTGASSEMLATRGYDEEYSPRRITKLYLDSILRGVLDRKGEDKLDAVTVCVPEVWGRKLNTLDGRSILREVIRDELDVPVDRDHVRVVTEPEAASAFFAYDYEKETGKAFNAHLLLIDYGGGTLDITLTEVRSDGKGKMEIWYCDGDGDGENHPDENGFFNIGCAGIAFMQALVTRAILDAGLEESADDIDFTDPEYTAAVHDLESQLKSSDRMKEIEDFFGSYGSGYRELAEVLEDEETEFTSLEYKGEDLPVSFSQLFLAYRDTIENVLAQKIEYINKRVEERIGTDPCDPSAGIKDNFKIALVGGFSSFFLVKRQLAEIYKLDSNLKIDLRTKNINGEKREQAISLGAALIASEKVVLKKTARFSIGLYSAGYDGVYRIHYGIRFRDNLEPGKPYFILRDENGEDVPGNRHVYGALHGNVRHFVIGFTDSMDEGGLMALRPEVLKRLELLPKGGHWYCGFSIDESDVVSFHIVPHRLPGVSASLNEVVIPLDNYRGMFDLSDVKEVTNR